MLIRTNGEPDDPRRDFLVRLLGCGFFAAGGLAWRTAAAMGRLPRELPPGKSIYELTGRVLVNGRPAREDMVIRPNDTVVTGPNSRIIFAVGKDAFLVRPNSRIVMEADNSNAIVRNLRLVTGKILSVLGARPARTRSFFRTPTATVGIRGTGLYMEAEPDLSYICTCYGEVRLEASDDPSSNEDITSEHHDAPRYVTADGPVGSRIREAPFINHTDLELILLEELVGREPPIGIAGVDYSAPRRGY